MLSRVLLLLAAGVAPAMAQDPVPAPAPPPVVDTSKWPKYIPAADVEGRDLSQYGYVRKRRLNKALVVTGASVFGGAYVVSTMVGAIASDYDSGAVWMLVPVAGPVGWAATTEATVGGYYILGVDALAQAAGVVLFSIGMHGQDGWQKLPPSLMVIPTASANSVGLTAAGTF